MTQQRREVPFAADTLAWVHNELAEIKSRLSLVQQAAEQSRSLATDASDKALAARSRVEQFDVVGPIIEHIQDDLRSIREQMARGQDDVHSLRQSREEIERRVLADAERARQDRNEIARHFAEMERAIEGWLERLSGYEDHGRRNMEVASHLTQRMEAYESQVQELDTLQSRTATTISRLDNEVQRLSGTIAGLGREDDVHRERTNSAFEMLRRLETELEAAKAETNKISRLDDRLELVQAERTRHNEHINEINAELQKIDARIGDHGERLTLLEVRMGGYQEEIRKIKERMMLDREQVAQYLHSLAELDADMRKRQIIALEKEIRDVRGRAIHFADE